MLSNTRRVVSSISLFKRACSTQSIEAMLAEGKRLTEANKFSDAKKLYEQVMDKFPSRHEGYDGYYYSVARTSGIFGPSQRLFNHLQKQYFQAVKEDKHISNKQGTTLKR